MVVGGRVVARAGFRRVELDALFASEAARLLEGVIPLQRLRLRGLRVRAGVKDGDVAQGSHGPVRCVREVDGAVVFETLSPRPSPRVDGWATLVAVVSRTQKRPPPPEVVAPS